MKEVRTPQVQVRFLGSYEKSAFLKIFTSNNV